MALALTADEIVHMDRMKPIRPAKGDQICENYPLSLGVNKTSICLHYLTPSILMCPTAMATNSAVRNGNHVRII